MAGTEGTDNKEQQPASFAGTVLKTSAVAAAVLYFLGWVYLHRYFRAFEIEIAQLELGWHDILIHSTALVRYIVEHFYHPPVLILLVVLLVAAVATACRPDILSDVEKHLGTVNARYILPMVTSVLLIYVLIHIAQSAGEDRALQTRRTASDPTNITFKEACKFDATGWIMLRSTDLKLERLFATPKHNGHAKMTGYSISRHRE